MASQNKIVDAYGRPVDLSSLTKELAAPDVTGLRQAWYESVASGLAPERLASIIIAVDQGDNLEYLTLAEEMEERDLHYRSVIGTRKLAVSGLDIMVEAVSDEKEDVEIADFVREVMQGDIVDTLVDDQLDAIGKGYAVSEIMWDKSGAQWEPAEFKRRDQRHFMFESLVMEELRLRDTSDPANGLPLAPYKYVVHRPRLKAGLTLRAGLARLAVIAYMCKSYMLKDWLAFAEVFGMPIRVGKYPTSANPDQRRALLNAVSSIGVDAACIIPDGMVIDFIDSKSTGGETMFQVLGDWLDDQVSEGVLGQRSSTKGTPGRLGGDDAQENVRSDIRQSDAKQLAATLRRDLVKPLVDLNYGPRAPRKYPLVKIDSEESEDLAQLATSLTPFIDRGLRVEASVIRDKFHLEEPAAGAEVLQGAGGGTGFGGALGGAQPLVDEKKMPAEPGKKVVNETPASKDPVAKLAAVDALVAKVVRGEALSGDERLALAAAARPPVGAAPRDLIDEAADEALGGWRKVMGPLLDPIAALAERSSDEGTFRAGLGKLLGKLSSDELVRTIATLTFEARGLGDVQDKEQA